jgi:hypothetical protein
LATRTVALTPVACAASLNAFVTVARFAANCRDWVGRAAAAGNAPQALVSQAPVTMRLRLSIYTAAPINLGDEAHKTALLVAVRTLMCLLGGESLACAVAFAPSRRQLRTLQATSAPTSEVAFTIDRTANADVAANEPDFNDAALRESLAGGPLADDPLSVSLKPIPGSSSAPAGGAGPNPLLESASADPTVASAPAGSAPAGTANTSAVVAALNDVGDLEREINDDLPEQSPGSLDASPPLIVRAASPSPPWPPGLSPLGGDSSAQTGAESLTTLSNTLGPAIWVLIVICCLILCCLCCLLLYFFQRHRKEEEGKKYVAVQKEGGPTPAMLDQTSMSARNSEKYATDDLPPSQSSFGAARVHPKPSSGVTMGVTQPVDPARPWLQPLPSSEPQDSNGGAGAPGPAASGRVPPSAQGTAYEAQYRSLVSDVEANESNDEEEGHLSDEISEGGTHFSPRVRI